MDTFTMPIASLSADEAINGQYGPAVQPAAVQASATADAHPGPVALPNFPNTSAVLVWWFVLLGLAVLMHVLFLRISE